MNKSKPLVFFGTEEFSAVSLKALLEDGWNIAAVITKPDSKQGRGQEVSEPAVKLIAKKYNVPVLQPQDIGSMGKNIRSYNSKFAVLVAYGKIVPAEIIDTFEGGIINLHPSLLPKYRGPAPIEAAILNGDKETGLSLMKLTPKMDAGSIYAQEKVKLSGKETKTELYKQLAKQGANLLIRTLPGILSNEIEPLPQDDKVASYTKLIRKDDGIVDFKRPAEQIEREVRAYLGWPKSRAVVSGKEVIIIKVRVVNSLDSKKLIIQCGNGYIEILELTAPSGRTMTGEDFIRGYLRET